METTLLVYLQKNQSLILSYIDNVKNGQCEYSKIFKVCLAIFNIMHEMVLKKNKVNLKTCLILLLKI